MFRFTTKNDNEEYNTKMRVSYVNNTGKCLLASGSTTRKLNPNEKDYNELISGKGVYQKEDGTYYIYSNFNIVFFGNAYKQAVDGGLADGDLIQNIDGQLKFEANDTRPRIIINKFDFVSKTTPTQPKKATRVNYDKPPVVEQPKAEYMSVGHEYVPADEEPTTVAIANNTNDEELPF